MLRRKKNDDPKPNEDEARPTGKRENCFDDDDSFERSSGDVDCVLFFFYSSFLYISTND